MYIRQVIYYRRTTFRLFQMHNRKALSGHSMLPRLPGLFYLYEQQNSQLAVKAKVTINGVTQILQTSLPQRIVRNFVYTLRIKGTGAKLEAEILTNQWEAGDQEEGAVNDRVSVDLQSLPANVTCEGNRIYISHVGNNFSFRLHKQEAVNVQISSSDSHFQVTPMADPASFQGEREMGSSGCLSGKRTGCPDRTYQSDPAGKPDRTDGSLEF